MAAKETSTANQTLDKWFGNTNFTPPATWYIGLIDADGDELTETGYARLGVPNNTTNFPNASAKQKSNPAQIILGPATEDWTQAVKIGFWDASTSGNLKFSANLDAPVTVADGQEFVINIGDLVLQEL